MPYIYGSLTTGTFYRNLKKLNPRLKVCSFDENGKLAGLFIRDHNGESYFDICGVDKEFVPEYTEWDAQGHIIKSGWRRVYQILAQLKLTTPERIKKVCPGFYLHKSQFAVDADRRVEIIGDPIKHKLQKFAEVAPVQSWRDPDSGKIETGTALTIEQNLELAADIQAKDSQPVKEQNEKDKWFLETWKERGGNVSDKPKI